MFRNNVGPKDRVYRAVAAIILVSTYFSAPEFQWRGVVLFIGIYLLFSAVMSTCAIYSVVGRNTNQEEDAPAKAES